MSVMTLWLFQSRTAMWLQNTVNVVRESRCKDESYFFSLPMSLKVEYLLRVRRNRTLLKLLILRSTGKFMMNWRLHGGYRTLCGREMSSYQRSNSAFGRQTERRVFKHYQVSKKVRNWIPRMGTECRYMPLLRIWGTLDSP